MNRNTVLAQKLLDVRPMLGTDVYQQDILRWRKPHLGLEPLDHPLKRGLELVAFYIFDPAIFNEQPQEEVPIVLLMPAQHIALPRELDWPRRLQLYSRALLDLSPEPGHAFFMQDIFEAGVLAVCAVAEIAMDGYDRLGHSFQMFRHQKTNDVREPRESGGVVMGHPEAAAGEQVVARQLSVLRNGHETEVIAENIDIIQRRDGEASLEFAWQVMLQIQRVHEVG